MRVRKQIVTSRYTSVRMCTGVCGLKLNKREWSQDITSRLASVWRVLVIQEFFHWNSCSLFPCLLKYKSVILPTWFGLHSIPPRKGAPAGASLECSQIIFSPQIPHPNASGRTTSFQRLWRDTNDSKGWEELSLRFCLFPLISPAPVFPIMRSVCVFSVCTVNPENHRLQTLLDLDHSEGKLFRSSVYNRKPIRSTSASKGRSLNSLFQKKVDWRFCTKAQDEKKNELLWTVNHANNLSESKNKNIALEWAKKIIFKLKLTSKSRCMKACNILKFEDFIFEWMIISWTYIHSFYSLADIWWHITDVFPFALFVWPWYSVILELTQLGNTGR